MPVKALLAEDVGAKFSWEGQPQAGDLFVVAYPVAQDRELFVYRLHRHLARLNQKLFRFDQCNLTESF
jgi:hypothetical protein